MTLQQLKEQAYELGLTDEDVSAWGPLNRKVSWEAAIAADSLPEASDPEPWVEETSSHPVTKDAGVVFTGPAAVVSALVDILKS